MIGISEQEQIPLKTCFGKITENFQSDERYAYPDAGILKNSNQTTPFTKANFNQNAKSTGQKENTRNSKILKSQIMESHLYLASFSTKIMYAQSELNEIFKLLIGKDCQPGIQHPAK